MTARAALVVLLSAIGALALPATGAGAKEPMESFSTRVIISEKYPAFHGKLHSKSTFCAAERPVRVFRERSGNDEVLGRRRSDRDGTWQISIGETS